MANYLVGYFMIFKQMDYDTQRHRSMVGRSRGWFTRTSPRVSAGSQRCLAHLIRKGLALAEGYYGPGSAFGRDLVRDLRRLIERVRDGDNDAAVTRLLARIEWNCQCNEYEIAQKVRALAREILNDLEAVIACVAEPLLSPTNNDAERAPRHAVMARRICFGKGTDEGGLSGDNQDGSQRQSGWMTPGSAGCRA